MKTILKFRKTRHNFGNGLEIAYQIISFENLAKVEDLPTEYLSTKPYCYLTNTWINGVKKDCIAVNYDWGTFEVGKYLREEHFHQFIDALKKAGQRLHNINKLIKAEKDYEFSVEI